MKEPALRGGLRELLQGRRLLVVSNRGPVEYHQDRQGRWSACRGTGGVVTALSGMARWAPVTWVSSAATQGDHQRAQGDGHGLFPSEEGEDLRVRFVAVPPAAYDRYYNLFSNPALWLLQHSLWGCLERPIPAQELEESWQQGYLPVNRAFATAVLEELARADTAPVVMFHDYHLYLAPAHVRAEAPGAFLTHFIHIPWPGPEAWRHLPAPMVEAICQGLLACDIVGFQTPASADNFLQTCQSFSPPGALDAVDRQEGAILCRGHLTRVRCYPVSVDVEGLRRRMAGSEAREHKARLAPLAGPQTIVRVDRMDPSKNVLGGFQAYDLFLARYPQWAGKVNFLAFLVPSRLAIPEYRSYADDVFRLVDDINARHGREGWQPIRVFYENSYPQALAGLSLYDVLLANPLADGMNLVSKEGPIVNGRDGVLVLSREAGSFSELGEAALAVDPQDLWGTADALALALSMPSEERRARARRLRRIIAERDLSFWLASQLQDLRALMAPSAR